jgi:hypothetical protein
LNHFESIIDFDSAKKLEWYLQTSLTERNGQMNYEGDIGVAHSHCRCLPITSINTLIIMSKTAFDSRQSRAWQFIWCRSGNPFVRAQKKRVQSSQSQHLLPVPDSPRNEAGFAFVFNCLAWPLLRDGRCPAIWNAKSTRTRGPLHISL